MLCPFTFCFCFVVCCSVRFGFVCLSTAYILVLICVIEWLVLISISFLPTSLPSAASWVSRVFRATRCDQFRGQQTNYECECVQYIAFFLHNYFLNNWLYSILIRISTNKREVIPQFVHFTNILPLHSQMDVAKKKKHWVALGAQKAAY